MFASVFKFAPDQPRGKTTAASTPGSFAPASGGKWKTYELFKRLSQKDGGFTYQPTTKEEPKTGFALSLYPKRSFAKDAADFSFSDLVAYAAKNQDLLSKGDHFLGAWHDPETDRIFLDVSVVTQDKAKAETLANKYDQIAYFDLGAGKSVTVNRAATSGGVAKGDDDGEEAYAARAEWIESYLAGGVEEALQKRDGTRTDGEGDRGSQEGARQEVGFAAVFKDGPVDEPRDKAGRWTSGGGSAEDKSFEVGGIKFTPIRRTHPTPHWAFRIDETGVVYDAGTGGVTGKSVPKMMENLKDLFTRDSKGNVEEFRRQWGLGPAKKSDGFSSIFKFDESQVNRGKTVEGTNAGSFAPNGSDGSMTAQVDAAAKQIYQNATKVEPFITQIMRNIAQSPARLAGLDFRLKGFASLEAKIANRVSFENMTPAEAARSIGDSVRYTLEIPESQYTSTVKHAVDVMAQAGFKLSTFKNYWGPDSTGRTPPYQGINTNFDNGALRIEVQFHTSASLGTKESNHVLYEEAGKDYAAGVTAQRRAELEQKMRDNQAKVPVPEGVLGFKLTTKYGTHDGAVKGWITRRGGVSPAGDETGKAAVPQGHKFVVYRLGSDSGLDNRNAGNAQAVAEHLARAQGADGPMPRGGVGQTITAYEVSVDHPHSSYETFNMYSSMGGARRAPAVGRMERNGAVSYSFPKGAKYTARRIGAVSVNDVHAHLKSRYGYENFDDSGSIAGAQAIRDLLHR